MEYKKNLSSDQLISQEKMKRIIDETNMSGYIDNFNLFNTKVGISNMITRIKIFEMSMGVPGDIVECGVFRGSSFMLFYHLMSLLEPYSFNKKIIGFDSFDGFKSLNKDKDSQNFCEKMFSGCDRELLSKIISINDLDRPLSHVSRTELIKGDAVETIPDYVKNNPNLVISLLYLDFDIYEPTKVALENLLPCVPRGGVVVLDQFNSKKWKGETLAFMDAVGIQKYNLKKFNFAPQTSYFRVE